MFLTLTLRDPPGGGPPHVLVKRHLQLFFKSLRYEKVVLSYFAVGEYGSKTTRAHYHVLLFSQSLLSDEMLQRVWGRGQIHIGEVQPESIDYCLAYVLKGRKGARRSDGRPPEFCIFSHRIGNAAIKEILLSLHRRGIQLVPREFKLYGKSWPLSRRHRQIVSDHGWDLAPKTDEETLLETEHTLLALQGVTFNSSEYQAWLVLREEVLARSKSRRIRDYYREKHGHLKVRNETF